MKHILMIASDGERWGAVRLPEPLSKAGLDLCGVLAPAEETSVCTG